MAGAPKRLLTASIALGVFACSFIVETERIDEGCPSGTKFCGGKCVGVNDPAYGCSAAGCDPCERDDRGNIIGNRFVPKCQDEECVIDQCPEGYGCDKCAVFLLSDPNNCGRCEEKCDHGTCVLGTCVPASGAAGAAGSE
jgi:hypothetical protein